MRSILLLLASPLIVMTTLAGLQSIEWHVNEGTRIPPFIYVILLAAALWCYLVANTNRQEMLKALQIIERWLDKLFIKQKK